MIHGLAACASLRMNSRRVSNTVRVRPCWPARRLSLQHEVEQQRVVLRGCAAAARRRRRSAIPRAPNAPARRAASRRAAGSPSRAAVVCASRRAAIRCARPATCGSTGRARICRRTAGPSFRARPSVAPTDRRPVAPVAMVDRGRSRRRATPHARRSRARRAAAGHARTAGCRARLARRQRPPSLRRNARSAARRLAASRS